MNRPKAITRAVSLCLGLALLAAPASSSAQQPAPTASATVAPDTPEGRSDSFRPVEGGGDVQSGEVLLVEAYAAIWILAFALIYVSYRRQKKLDDQIERLREDLARVRDGGG